MRVTLYETKTPAHNELAVINVSHVSLFDAGKLTIYAHLKAERDKLLAILADNYVEFHCKGQQVSLLSLDNSRVHIRFDP